MYKAETSQDRIGEFLVKIGAMSSDQRNQVLEIQAHEPEKLFGKIAVEQGYINELAIDTFLGKQPLK